MADSNGASLSVHSNRSVTPLGICIINRAEVGGVLDVGV
jgi:hypothetical protein